MTFEEFRELAANPPRRDEMTIFEVTEYDVESLPERRRNHYPKFSVRESRIGFAQTVAEGEAVINEAIKQAAKQQTEIYCFHIKEFPVGEIISGYFGISCRLYDNEDVCIDRTYYSDLDRFYIWDYSDDQITVINGSDYSWHEHVSPMFIMPLRYPLSKKLRECYEKYFHNATAEPFSRAVTV
ncbi:MAG: hypothetical protein K2J63_11120 [Muribaculaceae bacterium]|nr:hypothetical protein [Muribaculaceae bacterium]